MKLQFLCPQTQFSWNWATLIHLYIVCAAFTQQWLEQSPQGLSDHEALMFAIWPFTGKGCDLWSARNRMVLIQSGSHLGTVVGVSFSQVSWGVWRPGGYLLGGRRQS